MIPFGTPQRHVAQCGSTNDLARAWALALDAPAPSGALVTADFQTRGRGQRGRQWQAGWGQSALLSFVYRVPESAEAGLLGLVVALAVADALASASPLAPQIKWPNDILLDGRKVAGILVEVIGRAKGTSPPPSPPRGEGVRRNSHKEPERKEPAFRLRSFLVPTPSPLGGEGGGEVPSSPLDNTQTAILGIGVNVNQERFGGADGFAYPPTSLRLASGRAQEVAAVAASVAGALSLWEDRWRCDGFGLILEACRARLAVGADIRRGALRGELTDLTPAGAARVRLPGGTFADWHTVD